MDLLFLLQLFLSLLWRGSSSEKDPESWINVQEMVTLQEGLCVSIPCSFHYSQQHKNNNTAHGYWFQRTEQDKLVATSDTQQDVQSWAQGRFHLIGDPQMGNCSLSITGVQKQDHGDYWFQVEKGDLRYNYTSKMLSVHVEELTQKPEVCIPPILEAGHEVTLTCIAPGDYREVTPINFLWTGSALFSQGFVWQDLNSSQILFIPKAQGHGTNLTCQVTLPEAGVTTETTVQLRLAYSPRMLGPSCSWTEKGIFCTCSVQGELAPSLHWWVRDKIVNGNISDSTLHVVYTTSRTWTNSTLILAEKLDSGLSVHCEGRNHHGTQSINVLLEAPDKASSSPQNFLTWLIKGALCGMLVSALLFICLTVCLMKMLKTKLSRRDLEAAVSGRGTQHISTSITLVEHENTWKHDPSEPPPSSLLDFCSQEREDQVQYASIFLQVQKPQEVPKPEDTHTEYSELKL